MKKNPDEWPWTDAPPTEPGYYWARMKAQPERKDRFGNPQPWPADKPELVQVVADRDGDLIVWIHGNECEETIESFTSGRFSNSAHEWIAKRVAPLYK